MGKDQKKKKPAGGTKGEPKNQPSQNTGDSKLDKTKNKIDMTDKGTLDL